MPILLLLLGAGLFLYSRSTSASSTKDSEGKEQPPSPAPPSPKPPVTTGTGFFFTEVVDSNDPVVKRCLPALPLQVGSPGLASDYAKAVTGDAARWPELAAANPQKGAWRFKNADGTFTDVPNELEGGTPPLPPSFDATFVGLFYPAYSNINFPDTWRNFYYRALYKSNTTQLIMTAGVKVPFPLDPC